MNLQEEILFKYNPWWENEDFENIGLISREIIFANLKKNITNKQIIFLTGLRRVGKTSLLKLLISDLIRNQNINPKHIFYSSLDDYQFSKLSILDLIQEFRKIHRLSLEKKIYVFLDEITYKNDYEIQLKNLYDSQNIKIFASSSSASILKNKKPYLTGRNHLIEVNPLDFNEYLNFKNITLKKSDGHLLSGLFEDYMKTGGMPEYVLTGDIKYLKDLVDDILYKDIATFHKIKDHFLLKDYFMLLMERCGKICSINKIANILKISPDTARRYLDMFIDTFLIYSVPRYGKTNEMLLSPKKIYSADLGIRTYFTGFRDKGSLFENYVFLKIKDKQPRYILSDGIEIDFLTKDKLLIEVKYNDVIDGKQKELFTQFKAKKKILIQGVKDLEKIDEKK